MFGRRRQRLSDDYNAAVTATLEHLLIHFVTAQSLTDEEQSVITTGLVNGHDPVDVAHVVAIKRHSRHLILAVANVSGQPTGAEFISLN